MTDLIYGITMKDTFLADNIQSLRDELILTIPQHTLNTMLTEL